MKKIIVFLSLVFTLFLFFGCKKEEPTKLYTVNFNSNGGSEVVKQSLKENSFIKEPSNPTKEGKKFLGWYLVKKDKDGNTTELKMDFRIYRIKEDINLIAKWQ